jgi:hypothetical protein
MDEPMLPSQATHAPKSPILLEGLLQPVGSA